MQLQRKLQAGGAASHNALPAVVPKVGAASCNASFAQETRTVGNTTPV
jgi:hypothetical protein